MAMAASLTRMIFVVIKKAPQVGSKLAGSKHGIDLFEAWGTMLWESMGGESSVITRLFESLNGSPNLPSSVTSEYLAALVEFRKTKAAVNWAALLEIINQWVLLAECQGLPAVDIPSLATRCIKECPTLVPPQIELAELKAFLLYSLASNAEYQHMLAQNPNLPEEMEELEWKIINTLAM